MLQGPARGQRRGRTGDTFVLSPHGSKLGFQPPSLVQTPLLRSRAYLPWLHWLQAPVVKSCFIFSRSTFNVCRWHPGKRAVLKGKAIMKDGAVMDGILTGDGLSVLTVVRNASHSPGPQYLTATSVRTIRCSAGLGFSSRLFKVYSVQTHIYMCLYSSLFGFVTVCPNLRSRAPGLTCCSGWGQLADECLTRMYTRCIIIIHNDPHMLWVYL